MRLSLPAAWRLGKIMRARNIDKPDSGQDHSVVGVAEMLAAGLIWGLLPLYWKLLNTVSPLEIVAHRIIWSLVTLVCVSACVGSWEIPSLRKLGWLFVSACLIGGNWFIYIYAVQHNRVLECSLGYFIMPLVSVLLGLLILKEQLSYRKRIAVGLVAIAVLMLVLHYGRLPLIGLGLALTFSMYSLVRKQLVLGSWHGTLFEAAVLTPLAILILGALGSDDQLVFGHRDTSTSLLLTTTGLVTTVPILLSINASKRLNLTTVGLLQYLAPSIQFVLAIGIFREPFDVVNGAAFVMIWLALIVYSSDVIFRRG